MRETSGIGPVQCIVTGHDQQGLATILSDTMAEPGATPSAGSFAFPVWGNAELPARIGGNGEGPELAAGFGFAGGCLMRVIDMVPGQQSPMHGTDSIDFAIVIKGEIEMEMEDGTRSRIGEGGVVVQRATSHLWRNASSGPCRMGIVMIGAQRE